MNTKMYDYSQKYFKNKQFSNDILNRKCKTYRVSSGDTSFGSGTKLVVIGKENGTLLKCRVDKPNSTKTGYAATSDLILTPNVKEEFEIVLEEFVDEVENVKQMIKFLVETENDEFDLIDYNAWSIFQSLKGESDDKETMKVITKALLEISPDDKN